MYVAIWLYECNNHYIPLQVSEALGSKIRSQMDNICDSALNCEMSELESLCEDVLDDEEISGSDNDGHEIEGSLVPYI